MLDVRKVLENGLRSVGEGRDNAGAAQITEVANKSGEGASTRAGLRVRWVHRGAQTGRIHEAVRTPRRAERTAPAWKHRGPSSNPTMIDGNWPSVGLFAPNAKRSAFSSLGRGWLKRRRSA